MLKVTYLILLLLLCNQVRYRNDWLEQVDVSPLRLRSEWTACWETNILLMACVLPYCGEGLEGSDVADWWPAQPPPAFMTQHQQLILPGSPSRATTDSTHTYSAAQWLSNLAAFRDVRIKKLPGNLLLSLAPCIQFRPVVASNQYL